MAAVVVDADVVAVVSDEGDCVSVCVDVAAGARRRSPYA